MAMEFADTKTAMSTTAIGTAVIKKVLVVWISQMAACLSESGSAVCFHLRKEPGSRRVSVCTALMWLNIRRKSTGTKLSLRADASGRVYAAAGKINIFSLFSFAMVKSTEGATLQDPNFKRNFREAKSHGIIRGAYHFLSIQSDVDSQVRNFIDNTPLEIGDMPPVLDLEISKKTMERNHAKVCRMAREWLRKIENYYGVKPIIYTYENYYKRYMKGQGFDGYDFWIARYSAEPSARRWEIWQFTDAGRCTGINHDVDIDLFRGDYTALKNYVKTKGVRRTGPRR